MQHSKTWMRDMLEDPHIGIVQIIKTLYINILQESGQTPPYRFSCDFLTHTCLDNLSFADI